jgi:oligopeptidase A
VSNPLLDFDSLPAFERIKPEHAPSALEFIIAENRARLAALIAIPEPTFANLVVPVEELAHRLSRVWSPIGHLNGVANTASMRKAYNECLPLLTEYAAELGQNSDLYRAYGLVLKNEGDRLDQAQRKVIEIALRDFRLAGVDLPPEKKNRFRELLRLLAELGAKFGENVLDATAAFSCHVTDATRLEGLPPQNLARAESAAKAAGKTGFLLKLDQPTYVTVLSCARDAGLRREIYEAWATRASDRGPSAERFDNGPLIERIMRLRHEAASLLGFANFAEFALATRMARSSPVVRKFLHDLGDKCRSAAQREFAELESFAGRKLAAWDLAFYSERLKESKFQLSRESLRPYFPLPRVLAGLFAIVKRLYGIEVTERTNMSVWHSSVRFFNIAAAGGETIAGFYLDAFSRPEKRSGAWMDECVVRKSLACGAALPIAQLVCNFTAPSGSAPALLTHDEVNTLFHEFGHGLHHMLTRVAYPSVAGINGVAWDAVELPSQFMENYCWRPETLPLISAHIDSGLPLPAEKLASLLGSRTFNAALDSVRQLEYACFDFELHANYQPELGARVQETIDAARRRYAVVPAPQWNRMPSSFAHVFAGGYAAGYYGYKWAEVLAADAFSAFEEAGVFDQATATRFLDAILARGGSLDAMDAFIEFRGRAPDVTPLLRQTGIAA